jgi:hypothetical protein
MKLVCCVSFAAMLFRTFPNVAGQEDDDVRPSPPSIGADVPVTYFGPAPSTVQKELIGPLQLLTAGLLDEDAGTITLPLYEGSIYADDHYPTIVEDATIWYVLTDTTDEGLAASLGLNYAAKLQFTAHGNGSRFAEYGEDLRVNFDEASVVDFSPPRVVVPGEMPNYFPPTQASPGSVGHKSYSPVMYLSNTGEFFNAPVIADRFATAGDLNKYCNGIPEDLEEEARKILHDKVVAICPAEQTVTLALTSGHSFARPVLYLSLDASGETVAALEGVTLAPGLQDVAVGADDSFGSAIERIFVVVNGYTNADLPEGSSLSSHPLRNGLHSALLGEGSPLNVLGGIPTIATDYSPLWDVNLGQWTQEAVDNNWRTRLLEEFQILGFAQRGILTGPGGAPYGSTGDIVNCPIVHRFL